MPMFDVFAAHDGDTFHDLIEAGTEDEARAAARPAIAEAFRMTWELEHASAPGYWGGIEWFDGELDGLLVQER